MGALDAGPRPWGRIRDEIRARGLRWTTQRMRILEVLEEAEGHVTGSELVERCRERDPATTPSTVYRTLDVLESLGYLRHSHAASGREEFHVLPAAEHAHLECRVCGQTWEIGSEEAAAVVEPVARRHGFVADLGHLTILGRCSSCAPRPAVEPG
ncbi:MAG TPA: Fur family transcriptional regulator [Patescibacteria group bacterium]|nr:Fur family transcriptional regulator [Patescibacteria group bacterium]